MTFIILEVLLLGLPISFKVSEKKIKLIKFVGPIILCYAAGITLGT